MPSITLDVRSAKLVSKFGSEYGVSHDDGTWAITFAVKLPWRERLELGTGEKPEELDMHLTFRAVDSELLEWATEGTKNVEDTFKSDRDKLCGTVSYHKAWADQDGLHGRGLAGCPVKQRA